MPTLQEQLLPVARKRNIRAITKNPETDKNPALCRIDLIRSAIATTGYRQADIAAMTGLSVPTVKKALRVESSTKLYDFCAVLDVLGLEIAEVMPPRKRAVPDEPKAPKWPRGPYAKENAEELLREPAVRETSRRKRISMR